MQDAVVAWLPILLTLALQGAFLLVVLVASVECMRSAWRQRRQERQLDQCAGRPLVGLAESKGEFYRRGCNDSSASESCSLEERSWKSRLLGQLQESRSQAWVVTRGSFAWRNVRAYAVAYSLRGSVCFS